MKIGIDARPLIEKKTGIGFYLYNLLENILENDKENVYYLFSDKKIYFDVTKYKNVTLIENSGRILKKTFWYMFSLPQIKEYKEIDFFWGTQHVLPVSNKRSILTIHDLVAFRMPDTMFWYNKIINKICIPYSIKKAKMIISVSNSTKADILRCFKGIDKDKIQVIYEDACININEIADTVLLIEKKLIPKKYILYIGTIEPRKNVETLIKAYENLNSDDIKLVLAGKLGWKSDGFLERLNNSIKREDIIYLDYVSNSERNMLMKNSLVFVFPSLYEGFGLPVIEAMKLGSISIVSKSSSLDELIEIEELKFEAKSFTELTDRIENIVNDISIYNKCEEYCNKRANDFDWSKISKQYIGVFSEIYNG